MPCGVPAYGRQRALLRQAAPALKAKKGYGHHHSQMAPAGSTSLDKGIAKIDRIKDLMTMKVKDLPGWPPSNFQRTKGHSLPTRLPTHAQQVTIGDVLDVLDYCVRFNCGYENDTVICSLFVPDEDAAKKVAAILRDNKNRNLLEIRDVEILGSVAMYGPPSDCKGKVEG
jgi:hypothetical protein